MFSTSCQWKYYIWHWLICFFIRLLFLFSLNHWREVWVVQQFRLGQIKICHIDSTYQVWRDFFDNSFFAFVGVNWTSLLFAFFTRDIWYWYFMLYHNLVMVFIYIELFVMCESHLCFFVLVVFVYLIFTFISSCCFERFRLTPCLGWQVFLHLIVRRLFTTHMVHRWHQRHQRRDQGFTHHPFLIRFNNISIRYHQRHWVIKMWKRKI